MDLKKTEQENGEKCYLVEIHNLYSSQNLKLQTLKMKWIGRAARMNGTEEKAFTTAFR
jgi:hypothetical protein